MLILEQCSGIACGHEMIFWVTVPNPGTLKARNSAGDMGSQNTGFYIIVLTSYFPWRRHSMSVEDVLRFFSPSSGGWAISP